MAKELKSHLQIGEELKLFFQDENCPGNIIFMPNGAHLYELLERYMSTSMKQRKYLNVKTPLLYKQDLWEKSGHWDKYHNNMYLLQNDKEDGQNVGLKPMNCPGHSIVFNKMCPSERDLPIRLMEFGVLHRNEPNGSVRGLFRMRQFTQDDAHIYCTLEQAKEEILDIIKFLKKLYEHFGFEYEAELSTRPDDSIGNEENWSQAEEILTSCIGHIDPNFELNVGDGAFYGPKIDISIKDSQDRKWQCGTIQLDLTTSERLGLKYAKIGKDHQGEYGVPVVVHRAILGSLERFIGILLEHTQGNLPFWLSPKQICIIPVKPDCDEATLNYIKKIKYIFGDYKVTVNLNNDTFPKKIRNAEVNNYHYIFIVGEKEIKSNTISYRHHRKQSMQCSIEKVLKEISQEYEFMNELE